MIESTQGLGNDLAGVMALQRKLTGMEKDLEAIQVQQHLDIRQALVFYSNMTDRISSVVRKVVPSPSFKRLVENKDVRRPE